MLPQGCDGRGPQQSSGTPEYLPQSNLIVPYHIPGCTCSVQHDSGVEQQQRLRAIAVLRLVAQLAGERRAIGDVLAPFPQAN